MANNKIRFVKEQFSAAVGNSSVVVKFVAATVTVGYLLTFITSAVPYITITPGYVIPPNFRFYSLITYAFIEFHFWDVLIDIAVVVLCGKLLEPLWGALDMLIFFSIVNVSVGLLTSFCYLFEYFITKNADYLFDTHIYGLAGFIAAFSVAVKQVMPDHILFTSPFGKLRNTHIPLLLLVTAVTLRLIGLLDSAYPYLFGWGIVVSWIYLRFYQKHSNGNRGDMADNFSFGSFFPSQLQPIVGILANTIFLGLVKLKICKKPQRRYDVSSPTTLTISLPGTDPQDAERRRQVALKALNERLNKSEQPTQWPSLDDDGEKSPSSSSNKDSPEIHQTNVSPTPQLKTPDSQEIV
ncbi:hypothetical protein LOTGIDRAFT_105656 [Lottia gigantea]|uniref:Transmembrane protein 115 n=1 Tax=Lottia gigantea TaxID=225164 RepID=V4A7Y5_LOTGI|nr:hypothetical protein LOTGIDRAFT_105656 [Lottia gigantea]ESO91160.1 hypothetical protein LOTGIDRAFT_105656 [Lottia gigantea]